MSLEDRGAQHDKIVVDKFIDPVASTQMTTSDYVVRPTASSAIIITLPPVVEAKGRFYSIFARSASGANTITISDKNDSENWSDIVLDAANEGRLFYSDGIRWNTFALGASGDDVTKSSSATSGAIHGQTSTFTQSGASTTTQIEAFRFIAESNVETGQWFNAILAKLDYKTAGYAYGSAGVVCAELDMPGGAVPGGHGTYWVYEAELNLPTSYVGGGVPLAFFGLNVWGAEVAQFDTDGYLFDLTGVTKASGKFFQDNTAAAASQALRCRINGTAYYLMLTSTGA